MEACCLQQMIPLNWQPILGKRGRGRTRTRIQRPIMWQQLDELWDVSDIASLCSTFFEHERSQLYITDCTAIQVT